MDEARLNRAMSRIEGALSRVEAAAASRTAPGEAPAGDDAHRKLQERVRGALRDLDGLIESLEG